jgi:hypothetical protein
MKKTFAQCLAVFLWALSMGAQAEHPEKAERWVRDALAAFSTDGCAYSQWLRYDDLLSYGLLSSMWGTENEAVSLAAQTPSRYLDFLDTSLKACSLPAGKNTPDPNPSESKWLERFYSDPHSSHDAHFNHADALALAGPSVKDGVTRYWQQDGKTRIRFALNRAGNLRSWAKRRGIALQLTRQRSGGPVYNRDPVIFRGRTAIPVFIVSPEGLTPARIVAFAAGGDACGGGNWVEVALENDSTPPVWAVIALRDPRLAKKAKVTRQRQLETQENKSHYLELRRGVLRLEFENDALPPLILVARQLGFKRRTYEVGEKEDEWIKVEEETLLGSAWGTEIFIADPAMEGGESPAFGRFIDFLGSPPCPPPAPE